MYLMAVGYTVYKCEPQGSHLSKSLNIFITLQAWLYFQEIHSAMYALSRHL